MANNRLFIRSRASSQFTCLAKSYGDGWEIRKTAEEIEQVLRELYDLGSFGNCFNAVTELELVSENDQRYKEINGLLMPTWP